MVFQNDNRIGKREKESTVNISMAFSNGCLFRSYWGDCVVACIFNKLSGRLKPILLREPMMTAITDAYKHDHLNDSRLASL